LNPNFNQPQSFTLERTQSGNLFLRHLTGTPYSIATRFKAVKESSSWPTTPMTPDRLTLHQPPPVPESLNFNTGLDDVEMEKSTPLQPGLMVKLLSARDEVGGPFENPVESTPKILFEATPLPSHVQKKCKTTHPKPASFFRSSEFNASDVFFSVEQETETSNDFVVYNPTDSRPLGEWVYVQKLLKRSLVDRCNTSLIDFTHENLR
jgi:hypothetical protein